MWSTLKPAVRDDFPTVFTLFHQQVIFHDISPVMSPPSPAAETLPASVQRSPSPSSCLCWSAFKNIWLASWEHVSSAAATREVCRHTFCHLIVLKHHHALSQTAAATPGCCTETFDRRGGKTPAQRRFIIIEHLLSGKCSSEGSVRKNWLGRENSNPV